ncbi:MAG: RidA family protein [Bacteroidetes bacterium]|nr:RidA family protein [Bacteroidota bacterium]
MKRIISTPDAPKAIATYSQAVEANGILYISGQIAIDPATGKLVEGGIEEQTRQVMKNIGAILNAAGYTYKDVVKTSCLISDMASYQKVNSIYGTFFPENPPSRAAYAVAGLPLGSLIEIETIACH